jgi:hypothetical protein
MLCFQPYPCGWTPRVEMGLAMSIHSGCALDEEVGEGTGAGRDDYSSSY